MSSILPCVFRTLAGMGAVVAFSADKSPRAAGSLQRSCRRRHGGMAGPATNHHDVLSVLREVYRKHVALNAVLYALLTRRLQLESTTLCFMLLLLRHCRRILRQSGTCPKCPRCPACLRGLPHLALCPGQHIHISDPAGPMIKRPALGSTQP